MALINFFTQTESLCHLNGPLAINQIRKKEGSARRRARRADVLSRASGRTAHPSDSLHCFRGAGGLDRLVCFGSHLQLPGAANQSRTRSSSTTKAGNHCGSERTALDFSAYLTASERQDTICFS